jgi:FAD/FMN-containing dehydrogenase
MTQINQLRGSSPSSLGSLIHFQGESGYEEARVGRVFNGRRPQRFPVAVLFARSAQDVVEGVKFARSIGVTVSVRSGGHSWAVWSVREDALLIDLGNLREMSVDTETKIISVSPSITGGELNPYLKQFGLFFAGGHCPTVGLGGFLLQGGQGWNARGWGWSCEQIVAIDVVTADGQLLRADAHQNTELFWSARGAGPGFFGIVVRFELRARPLTRALTRSTYVYSMEDYDHVMPWLYDMHGHVDSSVEIVALGIAVPVSGREEVHSLVVHLLSFADTPEEALVALKPFESCPVLDRALVHEAFKPTSIEEMCEDQIRANPAGARYVVDALWTGAPPDKAVPALKPAFTGLPTKKTFMLWYSMAPLRPLPDMAFTHQCDVYVAIYCVWEEPDEDDRVQNWLKAQMKALEPISDGLYIGDSDFGVRSAKFIHEDHWKRLCEYRERFDPEHLFESYLVTEGALLNQNALQV